MNTFASRFALLSLALGVVSFAPTAFAQDNADAAPASAAQHHAPDPQKQAARLAKQLDLSNDQLAKISAVLQNHREQLSALHGDSSLAPKERMAKMRSIQQDADTQINAVLTPDQQKQYAVLKQNMMNHWQHAHGAESGADASNESH